MPMTFRGVVKNGVIVLDNGAPLRDGDVVEVARAARRVTSKARTRTAVKAKPRKSRDPLPGFGVWADRADWKGKSSARIARDLRRAAAGRKGRG